MNKEIMVGDPLPSSLPGGYFLLYPSWRDKIELHFFSSDPSKQSLCPSHLLYSDMQYPYMLQVNSLSLHCVNFNSCPLLQFWSPTGGILGTELLYNFRLDPKFQLLFQMHLVPVTPLISVILSTFIEWLRYFKQVFGVIPPWLSGAKLEHLVLD